MQNYAYQLSSTLACFASKKRGKIAASVDKSMCWQLKYQPTKKLWKKRPYKYTVSNFLFLSLSIHSSTSI